MAIGRRGFLTLGGTALGAVWSPGLLASAALAKTPDAKLDDWDTVRAQFRLDPALLHFAGFYIASHPTPVRAAIEALRDALDANPFATVEHGMFADEAQNLQRRTCLDVAQYLGGRAEDVALTANTTTSLALVYNGLVLKPGDEVLATTHDHYSHHEAIRLACQRNGAATRRFALFEDSRSASVDAILARVRAAIAPRTRVLGITWVHSATGIRLPVRAISAVLAELNAEREESERVLLVVDGVHGIGAVDEEIAAMGCDYFCAGTHKWMFAPRGTGIAWAGAAGWARLRPLVPSFSDFESYEAWMQQREPKGATDAARMAPGGFHAYEHQWAMGAAFRMHLQIGRSRIAQRIHALNAQIKQGLAKIAKVRQHTPAAEALSAGICCFEVDGISNEQVVAKLLERKVIASTSPYAQSHVRLAAGLMNSPEQVERAVAAVAAIAR